MVIDLTPEQEAHLQQIADFEGKSPQQVFINAAFGFLEEEADISRVLDERSKEAELGVLLEHGEVKARMRTMLVRG